MHYLYTLTIDEKGNENIFNELRKVINNLILFIVGYYESV